MQSHGNIVKLNVGGTIFQTTKSTLTKKFGMFKVMMETEIPVTKDESGAIFIDRDPTHFRLILNYMRDGEVELPDSVKEIIEIQKEAQYYLLNRLVYICKEGFQKDSLNQFQHINSYSDYVEAVGNQSKPVLIIHYPVFENGPWFDDKELKVIDFAKTHRNELNIYFRSHLQRPGIAFYWQCEFFNDNKCFTPPRVFKATDAFLSSLKNDIRRHGI